MKKTLIALIVCTSFSFFAQDDEGGSKKFCNEVSKDMQKLYEKGTDKKKYKKPERLEFLRKCLQEEPDFAEANLAMGLEIIVHCKLEGKPFTPATPFFLKAISSCPQVHSEPYYYIGFDYYEQMKNDSAVKYLEKFIKFKDDDEKKFGKEYDFELSNAKEMVKFAKKESELKKKVVPFDPKVVKGVSTERDEYLAYISPDDKICFFVRRMPINNKDLVYQTDKERDVFMYAIRDKTGVFNGGDEMPFPFNETQDSQGGCTISIDNTSLYFAMMRQEGGAQANCDIYVSKNRDDEWKPFQKLGPQINHPVYWDSQPTISADGNTLIFASDRPGGFGGIDLYISRRDPVSHTWGPAQNLGPKINTAGHEKTPFLHSDSQTLYFSSDGHFGFGGMDIFYIRKNEKGEWNEAQNIGTPINSDGDDTGFFVSTDALTGYFFSDESGKVRGKGVGRYDLYSFPLYKEARPKETAFLSGEVKTKEGDPVWGAQVELQNTKTKEKTLAVVDTATGKFLVAVNVEKKEDLVLTIKNKELAFSSSLVSTKDISLSKPPAPVVLVTDSVKVGSSFVINNIYYNINSADLMEESKSVLLAFAEYLKERPKINIEIQGHTDNVGNASANQALSANRAFTVKALLESYGVDGKRITAKGFGSSRPLTDNTTEAGRAKNRRTEFLITGSD